MSEFDDLSMLCIRVMRHPEKVILPFPADAGDVRKPTFFDLK